MSKRSRYSQRVQSPTPYQKSRQFEVVQDPSDPYGYRLVRTKGEYYGPAYAPDEALGLLGEGNMYGGLPYDLAKTEAPYYQNQTPVAPTAPVKEDVGFKPQLADYEKVRKIAAETGDPEAIKQAEELGMAIFNAKYSEENPGLIAGDRGVSFNNRPVQNPLMAKYFPERLKQPSPYGADTLAQQNEFYQADIGETFVDPPTVLRSNIFKGQPEPFTIENQPDGTPTMDPRYSNPVFTETMESMLGVDPSELMRATYSMGSGQSIETLPANTSPEAYMTQLDNKSLEVQDFMEKFLANKLGAK